MDERYHDDVYNRMIKFVDNFKDIHHGVSNVYVFTSIDKDGNITDEKYGMNLMTNYGLKTLYSNESTSFSASDNVKLYVGQGNNNILVNDSPRLQSVVFGGLAATNSNTSKYYTYPIYYSKGEHDGEGLITTISRFLVCYYDYNIAGYTDPVYISEYGIGTAYTSLWTHSHVYDLNGSKAQIIKYPNEKLIITVYMCLSIYEYIIQQGWFDNKFIMLTSNNIMYNYMRESSLNIYKNNNILVDKTRSPIRTRDTSNENVFKNSTILQSFIINDVKSSDNNYELGYIDGFVYKCTGFLILEPEQLETPEDVDLYIYSKTPTDYDGFVQRLGVLNAESTYDKSKYPPITNMSNVHAYLYDWKNESWTNEVDVYNPDGKIYDETPASTTCGLPLYYSNNGEILTAYVYQNIYPDDRIIGIRGGGITIYATNKYWANTSTSESITDPNEGWVWIRDYNNIPENCKSARYWITNNNTDSLIFVREKDCFQLLEKGTNLNGYEQYISFVNEYSIMSQTDNYEFGWYKRGRKIYIPSQETTIEIPTSDIGTGDNESMTYGKWLVIFRNGNNLLWYADMTNAKVNGTINQNTLTLPFTSSVNTLSQCYRTQSETGVICLQATNINEAVVLDMRNGFNSSLKQWKMSACIWGTNKIAYIPTDDTSHIHIYNIETDSDYGDPYEIPNAVDVKLIFGHSKYVWFTDGATYGYYINIDDGSINAYSNNIKYTSGYGDIKFTTTNDVFILYKYTECANMDIGKAHYFRLDNPGMCYDMTDFDNSISSYIGTRIDFILREIQNDTLSLIITRGYSNSSATVPNGSYNAIYDFGHYLSTGVNNSWFRHYNDSSYTGFIIYGENIIYQMQYKYPIMNEMKINIKAKTTTISCYNKMKNVSNKSWLLSYTNTPTWGYEVNGSGKPPGVPVARTDADGTITGWR